MFVDSHCHLDKLNYDDLHNNTHGSLRSARTLGPTPVTLVLDTVQAGALARKQRGNVTAGGDGGYTPKDFRLPLTVRTVTTLIKLS